MSTIKNKVNSICTSAVLFAALSACRDSITEVGGYECADLVEAQVYYGRPPAERMAEIREYPREKQYAVFVCGIAFIRPPLWDGAQPFIEGGASVVGFLKTKLRSAQSDLEISSTVALIDVMDDVGSYSAGEDKDLTQVLETSVARMRDPQLKREAEKRLQRIREAEHART